MIYPLHSYFEENYKNKIEAFGESIYNLDLVMNQVFPKADFAKVAYKLLPETFINIENISTFDQINIYENSIVKNNSVSDLRFHYYSLETQEKKNLEIFLSDYPEQFKLILEKTDQEIQYLLKFDDLITRLMNLKEYEDFKSFKR